MVIPCNIFINTDLDMWSVVYGIASSLGGVRYGCQPHLRG
jgi:hypothetical protein